MGLHVGHVAPRNISRHLRIVSYRIVVLTCCVEELEFLANGGARALPLLVLERPADPRRNTDVFLTGAALDLFEYCFL